MNSPRLSPFSRARIAATIGIFAALVVWPIGSHLILHSGQPALHFIPAFFLGLLSVVLLCGLIRGMMAAWKNGWRWAFTRDAGRLCVATIASAVSVIVLFYTVELWRGKQAYARVARTAQQLGEPLHLQALKPTPIPNEDNFAGATVFEPLTTMPDSLYDDRGERLKTDLGPLTTLADSRHNDSVGTSSRAALAWMLGLYLDLQTGRPTADPTDEAAAREALDDLEPVDGLLDAIREASRRPDCQFPWGTVNPFFSNRSSSVSRLLAGSLENLQRRAIARLRLGAADAAFEDLLAGLRVAAHVERQPEFLYVGRGVHAVAHLLQPLWEGLKDERWSPAQLAALQTQLESMGALERLPAQLRFQILAHTDLLESMVPTHPNTGTQSALPPEDRILWTWVRFLYPRGWSLQDQAALHAFHLEVLMPALRDPGSLTEPEFPMALRLIRASSDPCFPVFIVPKAVAMTRDTQEFLIFEQAILNLASTAVALERFHLTQGDYPGNLQALVPAILAAVPTDPVTAKPLGYRRTSASGYGVYSVGLDGRDDLGKPPPPPQISGPIAPPVGWDWVWQLDRSDADGK